MKIIFLLLILFLTNLTEASEVYQIDIRNLGSENIILPGEPFKAKIIMDKKNFSQILPLLLDKMRIGEVFYIAEVKEPIELAGNSSQLSMESLLIFIGQDQRLSPFFLDFEKKIELKVFFSEDKFKFQKEKLPQQIFIFNQNVAGRNYSWLLYGLGFLSLLLIGSYVLYKKIDPISAKERKNRKIELTQYFEALGKATTRTDYEQLYQKRKIIIENSEASKIFNDFYKEIYSKQYAKEWDLEKDGHLKTLKIKILKRKDQLINGI